MDVNEVILKEYFALEDDIEFAALFGSIASGRNTPMSDIDVAVYFKEDMDVLELGDRQIDITCAIMKLCHINRVDIVVLNLANPFLRYQVVKYGRLIYARAEKVFYKFKADSLSRYQDIKPMYDLYDRMAESQLRGGV